MPEIFAQTCPNFKVSKVSGVFNWQISNLFVCYFQEEIHLQHISNLTKLMTD
jgi:hypothetical protein